MDDIRRGVSIPVFCGFIKACEKEHGRKMAGTEIEDIRKALETAEMLYQSLPDEPPKPKRKVKTSATASLREKGAR